jgi:hypothetical protein
MLHQDGRDSPIGPVNEHRHGQSSQGASVLDACGRGETLMQGSNARTPGMRIQASGSVSHFLSGW